MPISLICFDVANVPLFQCPLLAAVKIEFEIAQSSSQNFWPKNKSTAIYILNLNPQLAAATQVVEKIVSAQPE